MKWFLVILIIVILGVGGYFFINQHSASVLSNEMKKELKQLVVEYISKDPLINNSLKLSQSWNNYNLGSDEKTRFTVEWLSQNQALVYVSGNNQATVEWQGIPGCSLNGMWELGYRPDLKDGNGKVCQTWWQVRVTINKETKVVNSIEIKEVGYEDGV